MTNKTAFLTAFGLLSVIVATAFSGCGGEPTYSVTGKVVLDGETLPDAFISFLPKEEGGMMAFGWTDDQGAYVLQRGQETFGIAAGEYAVRISTYSEGNEDADPPLPSIGEKVPEKYNVATELIREIKTGEDNIFDFELVSE